MWRWIKIIIIFKKRFALWFGITCRVPVGNTKYKMQWDLTYLVCRVGSLLLPLCDKRVDVLSKKYWHFQRFFILGRVFECSASFLIPGWYFYQWYIRYSFHHTTLVLISQMILLPLHQIVWSGHLVNDPLSSLLHLPLFEAEETVLQVWPLIYTFGQEKLSKLGKAREWNIRSFLAWTGAACWARAGDVWRGRGRVLLARGLNKDAAFIIFVFLSETILKWEPKCWVR